MKILLALVLTSVYLFSLDAFISPKELRQLMTQKNVVLLDTTNLETFNEGHIPGALRADISDFRHGVDAYQLMNSSKDVEKIARELGINNDSTVILYEHNQPKELLKASYMAMALIANGLENVAILNGGYDNWLYEYDGFLSKTPRTPETGNFTAAFNPNILVDLEYVRSRIGQVPMIEARKLEYFNAEAQSTGVRRSGHIAKAQSSSWGDKFNADKTLKSDEELNEIYIKTNKLIPEKEVVTYCTGGLEASMNWYILSRHLGFKDVKLYDASMREWGNRDDTPMEK